MNIVDATTVVPQPWRNGGGRTRELLTWPANSDWKLRISQADIEADGPFSDFAQVWRWITVIRGGGIVLAFTEGETVLRCGDTPLGFDGGEAPGCRLLAGPVQDLNLMARDGSSIMRRAVQGEHWEGQCAWRGLYSAGPGRWSNAREACVMPAHSLLWTDEAGGGAWTFVPEDPRITIGAWWLGYTPHVLFV